MKLSEDSKYKFIPPEGYYKFFPDPKIHTPESYLIALQFYSEMYRIQNKKDTLIKNGQAEYVFEDLAELKQCPAFSELQFDPVIARSINIYV